MFPSFAKRPSYRVKDVVWVYVIRSLYSVRSQAYSDAGSMPASFNVDNAESSCTSNPTEPVCSVSMRSVQRALFLRKKICADVDGLASLVAPVNSALVTAVIPACLPAFNASANSASSFFLRGHGALMHAQRRCYLLLCQPYLCQIKQFV